MIRTFGQYSTSKDLFRRGFCTVSMTDVGGENFWNARPQVVKSMAWPELVVGADRASDWVESFVESAELQRALAGEGASGWAPVHAIARTDDGGAYFVSDSYDASARLLAAGRYRWSVYNAEWLRSIVGGVLDALEELQNRRGRAHGNLRPGNILIQNIMDISGGGVALTDPATSSQLIRRAHGEHEDMRDLGLVLHQMILHVPFRELGGWPLVESDAWNAFGSQLGEQWRGFVSWLIDPKAAPGTLTIREARTRLAALPKAKAPVPAMKMARRAAMAVAALAIIGFASREVYVRTRPFDPELWSQYVTGYVTWAGPLLEDAIDDTDPVMSDERLGRLAEIVRGSEGVLSPASVLRDSAEDFSSTWAQTPPEAARRGEVPYRTRQAVTALTRIQSVLEDEQWPLRVALRRAGSADTGTLVDGVGEQWSGLAAYVRDLEARLTNFNTSLPITQAVRTLDDVGTIDDAANSLMAYSERFVSSGDPFLQKFEYEVKALLDQARSEENAPEFVKQLRGDDGGVPTDWPRMVTDLQSKAAEIDGFLTQGWTRVHREYLHSLERYQDLNSFEEPTIDGLDQWLALASRPEYVRLDPANDPRDRTLLARMQEVTEQSTALRDSPALVQRLSDALDEVEALVSEPRPIGALTSQSPSSGEVDRVRTLKEHIAYADSLYWVAEQREAVEQWSAALAAAVVGLEERVASISTEERRIAQSYVDDLRAETRVAESEGVNARWLSRRDALLAEFDQNGVLRSLVDRADNARTLLKRIDGALEAPDAVTAADEPEEWDGQRLLALVQAQREEQLEQVVEAIDWSLDAAALDTAVDQRLVAQQETYNAWQARVGELVGAMARGEDLMARLHLPEDKPADGGQSVAEIFDQWLSDSVMEDVEGASIFASIVDSYTQLKSLEGADVAALVAIAQQDGVDPVLQFGAWRRLGETDRWPRTPAELATEAQIREGVGAIVATMPDQQRASVMQSELVGEGQTRWERAASSANSDEAILAVMELEEIFGVDRTKLEPRTRYNTALADLRRLAGNEYLDQDEVVEAGIRDFIRLARATDGGRYASQADRMDKVLRDAASKPETINLSEYGPALLGWETSHNPRQTRVVYTSPNGVELEFALVRPRGSSDIITKPVFISTHEIPMRIGSEIMNSITGPRANAEADEIRRQLEEGFSIGATVGINWEGPRAWNWENLDLFRRGLMVNQEAGGDGWLWVNQFADQHPMVEPSILEDQERPGFAHPVNHISPFAADIFAKLIGCELPTAEQWQAAYAYHEEARGVDDRLWNLRDQTWGRQLAHATDVRRQLGAQASFFQLPDAGIFIPQSGVSVAQGEAAGIIERSEPDGVLWFARVADDDGYTAPGEVLKHMLGNVAEIVRVEEGSGYAVIGGSAMSPPEVPLTEPQTIARGFNQLERSYSDVGFRVSFETEDFREPMSVLLSDAMEGITGDY